jgi:redox-sensing transcriptional repressor
MKRTHMNISKNVIRRLPRYLHKLDDLANNGEDRISSGELGRQMGLTPSQIRQDFSCFGEFGQQGYGYSIAPLREQVGQILGLDRSYSVILVGVGNIGHALIENFSLIIQGYRLLGAFDERPELIGTKIGETLVYDSNDLTDFIRRNRVDIAILTVPRDAAQELTDKMTAAGIRAIWNFTNKELTTGDSGVLVEDIHFADSFLTLTYYLTEEDDNRK